MMVDFLLYFKYCLFPYINKNQQHAEAPKLNPWQFQLKILKWQVVGKDS